MAVKVHCTECGELVFASPGKVIRSRSEDPLRGGVIRQTWYPVPHTRPDGTSCDGHKRGI